MSPKEFKRSIRKARYVFGWVVLTKHDGHYLQITKGSALVCANEMLKADSIPDVMELDINATLRDDGDLYIG